VLGKADRVVARTAKRISAEIDKMVRDLPQQAASTTSLQRVLDEVARLQPLIRTFIELKRMGLNASNDE
jgi:hypothetical protein